MTMPSITGDVTYATDNSLTTHGSLSTQAMALGRKRSYVPRNRGGVDGKLLSNRIIELIDEQPVTPTLRQIYYLLVSECLIEKSEASYQKLGTRLTNMREGGMLPYNALSDINRERSSLKTFDNPGEALTYAAATYRLNRWHNQPVVPELWSEAGTIGGILWQVGSPIDVDTMVCRGNASLTFKWEAANIIHHRWVKRRQSTRILYCGDYDPSGMKMSDTLSHELIKIGAPAVAFTVERVALTEKLIGQYGIPGHPVNMRDNNAKWFVARYGDTAYEVEALPPAVLQSILSDHIDETIEDFEAWSESHALMIRQRAEMRAIAEMWGKWEEEHADLADDILDDDDDDE